MPRANFHFQRWDILKGTVDGITDVELGYTNRTGAGIRRLGRDDPRRWSPYGVVAPYALFETEQLLVTGLEEIFSVDWATSTASHESLVTLQVSIDGGHTFLAWDGAAWASQDYAGLYNSREIFNDHCAGLLLSELEGLPYLGFRLRLDRSALGESPELTSFHVAVEYNHHFHLDAYRTIKDALAELTFKVEVQKKMPATGASFVLPTQYAPAAAPQFKVFDVAEDPHHRTNLFLSYTPATRILTLSSSLELDTILAISYFGTCPLVIAQKDELITLSDIPVTVVRMGSTSYAKTRDGGGLKETKKTSLLENCRVRERELPQLVQVPLTVEHWTTSRHIAVSSYRGFRMTLRQLKSRATAETFSIDETSHGEVREAGDSYLYSSWGATLTGFEHDTAYRETVVGQPNLALWAGGQALRNEVLEAAAVEPDYPVIPPLPEEEPEVILYASSQENEGLQTPILPDYFQVLKNP